MNLDSRDKMIVLIALGQEIVNTVMFLKRGNDAFFSIRLEEFNEVYVKLTGKNHHSYDEWGQIKNLPHSLPPLPSTIPIFKEWLRNGKPKPNK